MKYIKRISIACLLSSSFLTYAQTDTTKTEEAKDKFSISGYLDSYYFLNLNNPQNGSNTGSSTYARAFDQRAGQFQFGLAQTKFSYANKNSEAVVDLAFGQNADLGNYGNVVGAFGAGKGTTALAIKQAYFSYNASEKLKFTAGQFGTHIGYEVIDAPINFNYSLSNLFNNGPFYHVGLKSEYTFNSKLKAMLGVVNNWDNAYDNNKFKTIIGQLAITPKDGFAIYVNYIGGNEFTTTNMNDKDTLSNFKQMIDLTATFQATDKLLIGLNAVEGFQSRKDYNANWGGVAVYSNYAFKSTFGLGARVEFFDNTSGVQYIGKNSVLSYTLTGNVTLADGHLLLKPEVRMDQFSKVEGVGNENNQQFMDKDGKYSKTNQTTIGLAMIYKW
jgi:hypothetical protein